MSVQLVLVVVAKYRFHEGAACDLGGSSAHMLVGIAFIFVIGQNGC